MKVRKFAVVFGSLFSVIMVAGAAGAEPETGVEARATTGSGGSAAASVSGAQYSDAGGGAVSDDSGGPGADDERGDDDSDKHPGGAGDAGPRGGSGGDTPDESGKNPSKPVIKPSKSAEGSRQNARQKAEARVRSNRSAAGRSSQNAVSRTSRQVTRQSDVSRESGGKPGGSAVAEARTVQSPEIRSRVKELRKKGKAGKLPPPATSYVPKNRRQELRIARRDIVARPVDEASLKRYKKLYEQAAEEYGFGDDWYVLAAVGKVESDHGQNMGPSSAGALGPMQFMPSTWESYGVDANEDGKANIMDPEDAIPSAARYLKAGGAPDDWYEALYTYNHAGWYVEKVLKMAERYRVAAGDDEVGPYYPSGR